VKVWRCEGGARCDATWGSCGGRQRLLWRDPITLTLDAARLDLSNEAGKVSLQGGGGQGIVYANLEGNGSLQGATGQHGSLQSIEPFAS